MIFSRVVIVIKLACGRQFSRIEKFFSTCTCPKDGKAAGFFILLFWLLEVLQYGPLQTKYSICTNPVNTACVLFLIPGYLPKGLSIFTLGFLGFAATGSEPCQDPASSCLAGKAANSLLPGTIPCCSLRTVEYVRIRSPTHLPAVTP